MYRTAIFAGKAYRRAGFKLTSATPPQAGTFVSSFGISASERNAAYDKWRAISDRSREEN
jgi:hypothetical protein